MKNQSIQHYQPIQNYQPMINLQEQNNQPNLIKLGILLVAFGAISYVWLKTSKELVKEIEKGWNDES